MIVRLANENELNRINELRKQLFDLHVANEPDVFEPGDSQKLQDAIYDAWNDPEQDIVVVQEELWKEKGFRHYA